MSNLNNIKQVANVERRTWDAEVYEKKAAARKQQPQHGRELPANHNHNRNKNGTGEEKEEFQAAPVGAAGPEGSERAFLQSRKEKVGDIDERVGETIILSVEGAVAAAGASADNAVKKTGVGWHCSVCDCFLKDSLTYLDHINGRKHQRKLGFSMRVERSSESDLLTKLNELKAKKGETAKEEEISYEKLVQNKDEEELRRKEERQRKRRERKKLQKEKDFEHEQRPHDDEEAEDEVEETDPALAAMMGFSGFGGGGKNH